MTKRRPTPHNVEVTDKERQALELRKAGASFDAIARQLGWADKSGAYRAVTRALAAVLNEDAEDLRALDAERLDRLLLAVWKPALDGDGKAWDRALRLLDQRARLLGLNAPTQVALKGHVITYEIPGVDLEALR